MEPGIDTIISEGFVTGLADLPLEEVRARRTAAQRFENAVSYVRRLAHGRLDILDAEVTRRGDGAVASKDLVSGLRSSLGGGTQRPSAPELGLPARAPQELEPTVEADPLVADLDVAVGPGLIAGVGQVSDEELAAALTRLRAFEDSISARRRALHDTLDTLQAEIVRRYRDDGVDVASVLGR
jgi:hypothetical protein